MSIVESSETPETLVRHHLTTTTWELPNYNFNSKHLTFSIIKYLQIQYVAQEKE